jgi:hypothetical protein
MVLCGQQKYLCTCLWHLSVTRTAWSARSLFVRLQWKIPHLQFVHLYPESPLQVWTTNCAPAPGGDPEPDPVEGECEVGHMWTLVQLLQTGASSPILPGVYSIYITLRWHSCPGVGYGPWLSRRVLQGDNQGQTTHMDLKNTGMPCQVQPVAGRPDMSTVWHSARGPSTPPTAVSGPQQKEETYPGEALQQHRLWWHQFG